MKNLKSIMNLRHEPIVLISLMNAISCVKHTAKTSFIVMGDNCQYWVVCMSDASRLEKMGYELIKD